MIDKKIIQGEQQHAVLKIVCNTFYIRDNFVKRIQSQKKVCGVSLRDRKSKPDSHYKQSFIAMSTIFAQNTIYNECHSFMYHDDTKIMPWFALVFHARQWVGAQMATVYPDAPRGPW